MNKSMIPVAVIGALLILVMILLSVFGDSERVVMPDRDRSARGYWALFQLLKRSGSPVTMMKKKPRIGEDYVYLVFGSEINRETRLFTKLFTDNRRPQKLLVIGYPESDYADDHFGVVKRKVTGRNNFSGDRVRRRGGLERGETLGVDPVKRGDNDDLSGTLTPLMTMSGAVTAFRWVDGTQTALIITDKSFLDNDSLLEGEMALILMELLEPWKGSPFRWGRPPEPRSYQGFGFFLKALPGIIFFHLLVLVLFLAWNRGVRLGRPDRINMDIRRELAEHCSAVGEFWHRSYRWEVFNQVEHEYWLRSLERLFPREAVRSDKKREQLLLKYTDRDTFHTAEGIIASAEGYWRIIETRDRLREELKRIKGSKHGT